jgi:MazG family protein
MAEELGAFRFRDVLDTICEKMIRRHPHVFGDAEIADAGAQTRAWEDHKSAERAARGTRRASALDGIPRGMPALALAQKLGRRAAGVGFDWDNADGVMDKLGEELTELTEARRGRGSVEDEIGDLLFTVVNLCRHEGVDAEGALRQASAKFERRFRALETSVAETGRSLEQMDADSMEQVWQAIKETGDRG